LKDTVCGKVESRFWMRLNNTYREGEYSLWRDCRPFVERLKEQPEYEEIREPCRN